mmetsp:Transcript_39623/g.60667  ORF Transcript_39623/g.60667 Transcript_39623/m.60667 type:complete len:82 (+) Transcript_39623:1129-1374(+)
MYYYSFNKNSYANMIKKAMWIAKEQMETDVLCVFAVMDHSVEELSKDFKFVEEAEGFGYYIVNYSFGDRDVGTKDVATIFL